MKNGKRPTKRQKIAIAAAKLNPDNWLVTKSMPEKLSLVHRNSGKQRSILV
ncbi:DUF6906 family protein [Paenibacillus periandrae]|uniref:DUF6906 family protein n=1 Tax=Paenibacillus periandrae TaxID=1761741 RepID=UPI001F0927D0|nr:hypothetical protein [Paenibacillus periandrae]